MSRRGQWRASAVGFSLLCIHDMRCFSSWVSWIGMLVFESTSSSSPPPPPCPFQLVCNYLGQSPAPVLSCETLTNDRWPATCLLAQPRLSRIQETRTYATKVARRSNHRSARSTSLNCLFMLLSLADYVSGGKAHAQLPLILCHEHLPGPNGFRPQSSRCCRSAPLREAERKTTELKTSRQPRRRRQ